MKNKIDAHTHIGVDVARKKFGMTYLFDGDLLLKLAMDNNVSQIIALPALGQIICPDLGKPNHPQIYGLGGIPNLVNLDEDKMFFECICGKKWWTKDPFEEANKYLFRETRRLNSYEKLKLHPISWVHPLKPRVDKDIREFYEEYTIKGVKINSVIDKTDPRNYIESEFVDIIKEFDLPILFHTDNESPALPSTFLEFAKKTGIKCQLAHGCFGDKKSLEKISGMDNVVVDLSPIEQYYKGRLLTKRKFSTYRKYLEHVISLCGKNKAIAASNFYWCGWTPESYSKCWKDFESFGEEDILYRNAEIFWRL